MAKQNRAFVMVHGAWQASEGWRKVADFLSHAGFPVLLIDLPGHGSQAGISFQKINLQTYVNYVCQKVQEIQKYVPAILVGHSMSGMVISQVAQNLAVQQLIYVSAFLPVSGECLLDIAKHSKIVGLSQNTIINRKLKSIVLDKNGLDKLFYHDCAAEITELALSRLQDEPLLPFYGSVRLTPEKFGQIRKTYIECLQDCSVSIELQRFMHNRWSCQVISLDTGHAPFYAMPEQLAQALIDSVA